MFLSDPEEDLQFLVYLHNSIIEASGGSKGFHDEKLVRSAIARPEQSAFGNDIHPDYLAKAAALIDSLANNHGFRDGNKRTAMAAASFYLSNVGLELRFTNKEYEEFMLHVVNDKPSIKEIKRWLENHTSIE